MKLLSVNISESKEIEHHGKIIATGIFKRAVDHKVFVHKINLQGDAQSDLVNHGGEHKAVYGFSSGHYEYWQTLLSQAKLKRGIFGENLTISDLNESELCIGDKLLIGECILEISQPRVPCFKLGIALSNEKMPYLFTRNFATGIYFRVKQEGFITAGDHVTLEKNTADTVSVQALFRAYFDKTFTDARETFEKAINIPELAPEWQEKVLRKLSKKAS